MCIGHFRAVLFTVNRRRKTVWMVSARLRNCTHCTCIYAGFVSLSDVFEEELAAAVFCQHIQLIIILVIFSSEVE
jgi:hypothetical protein